MLETNVGDNEHGWTLSVIHRLMMQIDPVSGTF
jgi:hypothetical protein